MATMSRLANALSAPSNGFSAAATCAFITTGLPFGHLVLATRYVPWGSPLGADRTFPHMSAEDFMRRPSHRASARERVTGDLERRREGRQRGSSGGRQRARASRRAHLRRERIMSPGPALLLIGHGSRSAVGRKSQPPGVTTPGATSIVCHQSSSATRALAASPSIVAIVEEATTSRAVAT